MIARRSLAVAGFGIGLAPAFLRAQSWTPNGPIRVVVPFPAGGTTDVLARLYAQRLTETMGVSVVVENRGGAGGSIGADVVAKAAPDGQTLLFHNLTFSTTTAAMEHAGRAPHSIERDFAPITVGANVPMMLLVARDVPVTNLREFAAWAKTQPTPPFYGSTGPGSTMNLVGEVLKRDGGFAMEHVPFRGAAPLVQDMLAGRIQFGGDQLSSSLQNMRSGALKPVATLSATRATAMPQVPTVREQGFPNAELQGWNGYFAPARTPEPILARLQAEIAAASRHPSLAARIVELGAEPGGNSRAEFTQQVHSQVAAVRPLVQALNLRVE
ncbi:tripartite tricarboxylate transporter substrate binding protein [Roseococcus sp. SYP-B2431]|uniref:Bug family tripartite tricarboxylate transporter substrate binding protein n=1 Tax=Roseococcus sp. SYP-B2431 TaxID=2496640 RepID=UPI00103DD58A|nr:tripartite tricarboxylate transporter substrate binding protein [Roseococcus sp. SYP-B2431]TCI00992.1 tripartite tricarboxylate transporter substrate binding protein [Roseococcus sp. SYP-B2431]